MKNASGVRPCAVCGLFYPGDPDILRTDLQKYIGAPEPRAAAPPGRIRGIIAPHAGYMYSGVTAAHAYALLKGERYAVVVIVAPSHQEYFDGISVFSGDAYATPLGTVQVHEDFRERLLKNSTVISASQRGHGREHAIEVQLPFLQQTLTDFRFLPVVVGDQKREYCYHLGEVLTEALEGEDYLLVASTDLSHYYPSHIANRLDQNMIEDVSLFDHERLMTDLEVGKAEACGGGPTVAVMSALARMGVTGIEILHHCNSGDVTGDHERVVGYLAAVARA